MTTHHAWLRQAQKLALLLLAVISLSACAGRFGIGGDRWKEEVLLHDGQTIIVQRSQTYRGRFEPGGRAPVGEHTVRFVLPHGQREWSWTSEYGQGLGRTNFNLVAIHAKDGVPYIVNTPNLCLSYNKWGRPNPPYVIFKGEENGQWVRIPMEQLPLEFSTINVVVEPSNRLQEMLSLGVVPQKKIQAFNKDLSSVENKTIVREPLPFSEIGCTVMHSNGKGLWLGASWFTGTKDLQSCKNFCTDEKFEKDTCPCHLYFKEK